MLRILRITLGLSVEAGLLNRTTGRPAYRVWVTVTCRRRLFERPRGHLLVPRVTLMCPSVVTVTLAVLLPSPPRSPTGVSARPLSIATPGHRPNRRNITESHP